MKKSLLVIIIIVIFHPPVFADTGIYKYIDRDGVIHFTNVPTDPSFKMIIPPRKVISRRHFSMREINRIIDHKAIRYNIDPALVRAIIAVESNFNPYAVSSKGAAGLMQLMPGTAAEMGVHNLFDPGENIEGGIKYLKYLIRVFNNDLDLALAAYHAGISRVKQGLTLPPIPATREYIKKVKLRYIQELTGYRGP